MVFEGPVWAPGLMLGHQETQSVPESLTGMNLCLGRNYLTSCKLSFSICHGLQGRENVDEVAFWFLQRRRG